MSFEQLCFFLAGAAFWDAAVLTSLHFSGLLPFTYYGMTLTPTINLFFIATALMFSGFMIYLGSECDTQQSSQERVTKDSRG